MSEPYDPDNLLDRRLGTAASLQLHYDHLYRRERELLAPRLPPGGDVLSVGCGWNPGRHLFPAGRWRMTGVDVAGEKPLALAADGVIEHGIAGRAGQLELPDSAFDVVLYRLILHHVAYQAPLAPVFAEAASLLRPGGLLVAVEPGRRHPVGAALALANRVGLGPALHGTADDIPLSPQTLEHEARTAGLTPWLHAVTYTWRRMGAVLQRRLWPVDAALGSRPRAAAFGHTLMLVARKPAQRIS